MIASSPLNVIPRRDQRQASIVESPRPKSLWEMQRGDTLMSSALVWTRGQWEIWLFGHELITWRQFADPRAAVAWADLFQQDLERDGWQ